MSTGMLRGVSGLGDGNIVGNLVYAYGNPQYNAVGEYVGGTNMFMDYYCNSLLGQWLNPSTCAVPSTKQQAQIQQQELSTTSAPPDVQAAAVAAGSASAADACQLNPADCSAQNASAGFPLLASAIGPGTTASLLGVQPDGSVNPFAGYGVYIAAAVGLFLLLALKK